MMNAGGGEQRRYVRASDRRLAEVAAQAAARIDLETLKHRRSEAAGVTTERSIDGTVVTATSVIECSLKEMQALLNPPTSDRYACVMRELVGQDFIYGSIVHHAQEITTQNVSVRTATFVKRHILARNEQWCFVSAVKSLESCDNNEAQGFIVTLASLHPDDVFTGKAQAASVIHIQGLSALYLVTAEPHRKRWQGREKRAVRVTFCAHVASIPGSGRPSPFRWLMMARNREEADDASNGVVLGRVVQLARTLKQFNVAVRRRRLDAQVLADLRKVQPSNSRCACCTRRVKASKSFFGSKRGSTEGRTMEDARGSKRCQLCGFLVCARCVCTVGKGSMSEESLASSKGIKYSQTVHLCEHCMQRVDDADYDSYCASNGSVSPSSAIQPDSPNAELPSAVIARVLSQVLGDASQDEKPVVIRVIKHLLSPKQEERNKFRADSDELAKSLGRLAEEQGFSSEIKVKTAPQVTPEGLVTLEDEEKPPLAGSTGRQYALQYMDLNDDADEEDTDDTDDTEDAEDVEDAKELTVVSRHPVPADEAYRLQWLDTHPNIISHVTDLPDLELLCNIAQGELQCDATLVTIFGPSACYVVASTEPSWRGAEIPRDHSICGHTLMTGEPLLVRHPEADVRFTAMNLVRRDGVRFYFGFPVKITFPEGGGTTAVGTFCCVHAGETRDVSESQYALMATLAEGVNRVMECRASRLLEG
ncbi:GAF domain-containing protein [Phytophthora infestans]|uniref:GAF domain-containing protein n=1 Tax=Phytophthora infestans TaxID=4787 RepID=A0A833TBN1_PHYIN|nr:GAF domain-containing protein [Phytophthora infestans]